MIDLNAGDTPSIPRWRLAVGLGDPERERVLLPALNEAGDFAIAERCLAADQILECVRQDRADVALLAFDLHRLTGAVLAELTRTRVPLVILAPHPDQEPWRDLPGVVLPLDTDAETLQQALTAAIRGERRPAARDEVETSAVEPANTSTGSSTGTSIIALASGHGSPGRTTIAISLATALGAVAPTVLVDADLNGPSVAACLDADPTHNLYMLAHAEPVTAREWDHALEQETQPLSARSPHGVVLCGVPKPEMRTRLSPGFFERLIAELQRRYRYVILDVGADLLGTDVALHRVALGLADQVLLVVATDLAGLCHGRAALGQLQTHLGVRPERVALVLNRYDSRFHHSRAEIEWVFGVPTAAVIPYDYRAAQRALAAQRPLVLERGSRAGRIILDLAERVHGGQIKLSPETKGQRRVRWLRWASALRLSGSRPVPEVRQEVRGALTDDEHVPTDVHDDAEQRSNGRAPVTRRGANGR